MKKSTSVQQFMNDMCRQELRKLLAKHASLIKMPKYLRQFTRQTTKLHGSLTAVLDVILLAVDRNFAFGHVIYKDTYRFDGILRLVDGCWQPDTGEATFFKFYK